MKERLQIDKSRLEELNDLFLDIDNDLITELLRVVGKYGTPEEINAKAREARDLDNLMERLKNLGSPYYEDLKWLIAERDKGSFVSLSDYRQNILGEKAGTKYFEEDRAVTLEISALQFFPWLISQAEQAIENEEVMPGRYIRVRSMKEQEQDKGDILAVAAAMQIIGASYVETLDTNGTDGSNVHLNAENPLETITGYFGGIGMPNDYALKWVDELLYYYTNYGIDQVLNANSGTVLLGYILYKLGIDITFKISVFLGNDNQYAVYWTLMMAKLLAREDGSTPLVGFNLSNSVNAKTLKMAAKIRKQMGLENNVRLEHHITETRKSIVRQPYNRRDDLLEVAAEVPNIAAKHEGGEIEVEKEREHPSDILDYFRPKEEIEEAGEMEALERNYLDKHEAVNKTAEALTREGLSFIPAKNLHRR